MRVIISIICILINYFCVGLNFLNNQKGSRTDLKKYDAVTVVGATGNFGQLGKICNISDIEK